MAIVKKLTRMGNSFGLVIDKPILELLGIDPDSSLEISTLNGKELIIKAVIDKRDRMQKALSKVNQQYSAALQALSDHDASKLKEDDSK